MTNKSVSGGTLFDAHSLENLSKEKAELLRLLLEKESANREQITSYPREKNEDSGEIRLPTSWAQQRLWFIDELEGGTTTYNIGMALRLQGELDKEALQMALDTLIQRHESLRTTFVNIAGEPQQIIAAEGHFHLQLIDLSDNSPSEQAVQVRQHRLNEEVEQKFDLQNDALIRGKLLVLNATEHMLLITMHHIISDGWSSSLFFREFCELYRAYHEHRDNPLQPLAIQYADYAQWQRNWMQGARLEKQLDYWRSRLADATPQLELPTDRPRPAVRSYSGENVSVILDQVLSSKLKQFAQQRGMSLFMVLYAGWATLLARLSGQSDIVVGMPVANRQRPELEELIGFFVNTLVLRVAIPADLRVDALLEQVKDVALGAYDHQDIPFDQVVETLHPQRSLSRNPIFQTMFVLQNAPEIEIRLPNLTATLQDRVDEPAVFDLWLSLEEKDNQIIGSLNYATDLFDRQTIQRWVTYFATLLNEMVDGTQTRIGDLRFLPESERHQVVEQFNGTQRPYPKDKLIHELFEEQAGRTPEAIAATTHEHHHLTYAELNNQANQLAHYLIQQGVQPGEFIPLLMPRSLSMLIAQLAVLKCGAVYVPLEPTLPTERRSLLLKDCQARRIIIMDNAAAEGIDHNEQQCINIAGAASDIALCDGDNPDLSIASPPPAYVMYTSGSTGIPKGVIIPHHAVSRLVINNGFTQITPADCIAHCSNPAFDASTFEIWGALLNGARVVIVPHAIVLDPEHFAKLLKAHHVSILWLTVGLFTQYLSTLEDVFGDLRYLLVGGDIVDPVSVRHLLAGRPPQHIINGYGPTEGTTFSATYLIETVDEQTTSIPIGQPISNTRIYILDEQHRPVPIGVTGEIYIGGAGVASGYLNRPELTAERFIDDPFCTDPQSRLYKSGDLGRWRVDGNIDFMGRNDQQVKIRGYRIETGEIEAALIAHDALSHAVVIADSDDQGDKKLIAYVCPTSDWLAEKADAFNAESLENWTAIFEDQYTQDAVQETDENKINNDFRGWNNSYTEQPIAIDQMEEWRTGTVQRIEALHPRRLLEIGCGTGLLLYRYAVTCDTVLATDISTAVLAMHQQELNRRGWHHVELRQGDALNLGTLAESAFDCVVINSVVQYFPNAQYLEKVLKQLLPSIEAGGKILLGDIRNLDLLSAHITAIEQGRLNGQTILAGTLANRIQRRLQQEQELLISPTYFAHLPERYPDISRVDLLVKRGVGDNEMLRYRYDVILHKKGHTTENRQVDDFNWFDFDTLDSLRNQLQAGSAEKFGISGIPNARISDDLALTEKLRHWPAGQHISPHSTSGSLSHEATKQVQAFESLLQYAEQCGYHCGVTWSQHKPDQLDVIFSRSELPPVQARTAYTQTHRINYPQMAAISGELAVTLESSLKEQLPSYMVPSVYIPLGRLPLTPNNKVDKKILPAPNESDLRRQTYIAPRNAIEQQLSQLWQQLLKLSQVGIHDNFFALGGHSLLATRLISAVRNDLQVEIPLRSVFEHPTIEAFSQVITTQLVKIKREHYQAKHQNLQGLLEGDI
ncbi:amino acid adenylation domain-containing protein [Xenorhabdus bovienii]|uniref:non-ribosomal peptide synthetase n=1 Tax=Xenorhabdus bovienii TaxID=40576 RepID=UPI0023AFD4C2|nr:non-ribosomal peptide synthetase [Xenorhabdus bovienii]MDE9477977.1 amino acid adenylation domain-containing protein [Xenorhabdus bovienii]